jgi:uncharacterized membrane protein YgaE (UPF0421/DUF939 family)
MSDVRRPHVEAALLRLRQYTEDALKFNRAGPPWHRGLVALAGVLGALGLARYLFHPVESIAVAPAMALFMTLADTEAPLHLRLRMLVMTAAGIAFGGGMTLLFGTDSPWLALVFLVIVVVAGLGSVIGPPFQQASRFTAVVALLMTVTKGIDLTDFAGMLLSTAVLVGLCRSAEHLLAPDQRMGDFRSLKDGIFLLRTARSYLPRFVVCYALAALAGYAMGRSLDKVHPTWVTVTVIVVMWPDAQRSYQRILQRVVGTLVGALLALGLIELAGDVRVLSIVAALMLYFLPHFIRRNYWLHTGLMMIFVMVSLDLWSQQAFSPDILVERVGDVLAGCALALLGTLAAFARLQAVLRGAARTSEPVAPPIAGTHAPSLKE